MFKGLIIQESLKDLGVLELVSITRKETWQVGNAAPGQPLTWTALSFEAEESWAGLIARKVSRALKASWYANGSTLTEVFVIFPGKVYRYSKGDKAQREAAQQFGRGLGIPEKQLDWSE